MRWIALGLVMMGLAGCGDTEKSAAREIVQRKLGSPKFIEFRRLRVNSEKGVVCGEVDGADRPGAGWRYFVAYPSLNDAAIAAPGEVTSDAEMGNPLLAGAANEFLHMCD